MISTTFQKSFLRRATTSVVALFLIPISFAAAKTSRWKEIQGRAQQRFLARQRVEALRTLREIPLEALSLTEREEWQDAQKEMATRFFSDKGQKLYEQGLSQLVEQPQLAFGSLVEAQKLEQSHVLVAIAQIRAKYALDDCAGAKKVLDNEEIPLQVLGAEAAEIRLIVAICSKETVEVEGLIKRKGNENPLPLAMQKVATAWLRLQEEELEKAEVLIKEARQIDPQNLGVLFYAAKWPIGDNEKRRSDGEKFLQRCKDSVQSVRRRGISMAELCYRKADFEAELKKISLESSPEEG